MNDRRVVITGLGLVTPAGNSADEILGRLSAGNRLTKPIERFDASAYPANHAGTVEGLDAAKDFSKRLLKKLDRFTEMALVATKSALGDAGIDIEAVDRERVGIILGNALGGWAFAEEELRDLYNGGLRDVSPYQATAWFPAAPQGQVSIHYGIKGFSKTIISDLASSHLAVGYAARAIKTGKADIVLAGGTEAPISPYALLCCNTSGELSNTGVYAPFDASADGYVIGEGAGVLVVEELERARARGARIYAEVTGFGHTSDGLDPVKPDSSGEGATRAMMLALGRSGMSPDDVDLVLPAGNGCRTHDESEANALASVFGDRLKSDVAVSIPKSMFGHLMGASGVVDMAIACAAMYRCEAPGWTGCDRPVSGWEWASGGGTVKRDIGCAMVNSIGRGGVNASIVIRKLS